jgi:hypothetical protein
LINFAMPRHQDVARFQIAMNDQILVRVVHGRAYIHEEPQPRRDVEPVSVAVLRDGQAIHVLHDDVRVPILGDAAVQQPRDVRMHEGRQNLPLGDEALVQRIGHVARANQLDRDLMLELPIGALGEVDDTGAATTDLANEVIRADAAGQLFPEWRFPEWGLAEWGIPGKALAGRGLAEDLGDRCEARGEGIDHAGLRIRFEELARVLDQFGVREGLRLKQLLARVAFQGARRREQVLQSLPAFRLHRSSPCRGTIVRGPARGRQLVV